MIWRSFILVNVVFFCFLILAPLYSSAQIEKPVLNLNQLIEETLQSNPEILAVNEIVPISEVHK